MYNIKKLASDIEGSEGPVLNSKGEFFMVAPNHGLIVAVSDAGEVTTFADTKGIPAGLQCDPDDTIWCADMKLGLVSITPDGVVHDEITEFEGAPMRGCNDCAFDPDGNLYITAPGGSSADEPVGELYCRTTAGEALKLDDGFAFCNGIGVNNDGTLLIVAETMTKSLWAYDIISPGKVENKRLWATHPDDGLGPDGMDFDTAGNLLVAHWGGSSIDVFDPSGALIERIKTPFEKPSNVHFGGPDRRDIYITEHDENGLWLLESWKHQGQLQYCDRG
jgi:gluconolactonase